MELPPMVQATKREDKAAKEHAERLAKAKKSFNDARKTVTKFCDHFVVNAELGFRVPNHPKELHYRRMHQREPIGTLQPHHYRH